MLSNLGDAIINIWLILGSNWPSYPQQMGDMISTVLFANKCLHYTKRVRQRGVKLNSILNVIELGGGNQEQTYCTMGKWAINITPEKKIKSI